MNLALALLAVVSGAAVLGFVLTELLLRFGPQRVNYRGGAIVTSGGLVFLLGALPWLWLAPDLRTRWLAATVIGFGLLGLLDDRWGTAEFKGLKGHLRALRHGRVTTGLLKAGGGLLFAAVLAAALRPGAGAVPAALLIALSANLFNLLDLRPLRTLKAFWLAAALCLPASPLFLAQCLGLSLPYAVREARRRIMLGDTGSNALGGLAGACLVSATPIGVQVVLVAGLAAFHLWAEKHSFSAWIESHPTARALDGWGWREKEQGRE